MFLEESSGKSPCLKTVDPRNFSLLSSSILSLQQFVRITSSYQFMTPATYVLGKHILVVLFFGMYLSLQVSGMQFAPLPQFYDSSKQINWFSVCHFFSPYKNGNDDLYRSELRLECLTPSLTSPVTSSSKICFEISSAFVKTSWFCLDHFSSLLTILYITSNAFMS